MENELEVNTNKNRAATVIPANELTNKNQIKSNVVTTSLNIADIKYRGSIVLKIACLETKDRYYKTI